MLDETKHESETGTMSGAGQGHAERPKATGWAWVVVLVAVLVIGFMILLPALDRPRKHSPRTPCHRNLYDIGTALAGYEHHHKSFPPAYVADKQGRPMHSWRVLILPYMQDQEFRKLHKRYDFDQPWNSPHNLAVAEDMPGCYRCPKDTGTGPTDNSYVMIVGPGTLSDGTSTTRVEDITDGTSNTIAVVEMSESGIHWTEPRDLNLDEMSFEINDPGRKGIRSGHSKGANVLIVDGSTHYVSGDTDPELIKAMITIGGGEDVSAIWNR